MTDSYQEEEEIENKKARDLISREFRRYVEKHHLSELFTELTKKCFEMRSEHPIEVIFDYISASSDKYKQMVMKAKIKKRLLKERLQKKIEILENQNADLKEKKQILEAQTMKMFAKKETLDEKIAESFEVTTVKTEALIENSEKLQIHPQSQRKRKKLRSIIYADNESLSETSSGSSSSAESSFRW